MYAKVLIPFKDKITKKSYKKDDVIEVSASRFNEILKKGQLIEAVEEPLTHKASKKENN